MGAKDMSKRLNLIITIIVISSLAGCVSIYRSVKEKRDKSYREGIELYQQNKFAEAKDRFQTVVDIEPDYKNAQSYLARSEKLIKMKAQNIKLRANVNYDRGVALMKQGQYEGALDYLLLAQREDPNLVDADEKIDQCRKKLKPRLKQTLKTAQWQYDRKQYLQAYWTCIKAKKYAPSDMETSQMLSKTEDRLDEKAKKFRAKGKDYYGKKQYAAAQQQLQMALATNPADKESKQLLAKVNDRLNLDKYYNNAITLYNSGNYFGARASFQAVSNIEPGYKATDQYQSKINTALINQAPMFYQNGVALYEKGNYQGAVAEFNKVLSVTPGNTKAQEYRQRAQSKLELETSLKGAAQ